MAKKRPKISLTQAVKPRGGDIEQLFSADDDVEQASGLQLLALRVEAIQPDPDQPRNTFPQDSLRELSESIRQDGVIQPIEVTEIRPNVYVIVHGERRWRAAKMAGLEPIPAVVRRRDYDELTRFVRGQAKFADVPILVISTDASHPDTQRALDAGADDYLVKPYQEQELFTHVERALAAYGFRYPVR